MLNEFNSVLSQKQSNNIKVLDLTRQELSKEAVTQLIDCLEVDKSQTILLKVMFEDSLSASLVIRATIDSKLALIYHNPLGIMYSEISQYFFNLYEAIYNLGGDLEVIEKIQTDNITETFKLTEANLKIFATYEVNYLEDIIKLRDMLPNNIISLQDNILGESKEDEISNLYQ